MTPGAAKLVGEADVKRLSNKIPEIAVPVTVSLSVFDVVVPSVADATLTTEPASKSACVTA